ncbi:MAG: hypothetical protein BEN19_08640 [Epulopiscium sp. Nuni2H_MBin003]|nr:MAG: hypothetical protein BEN19_08640 [Epulopiscium sp. Nuni2H_MBin003]
MKNGDELRTRFGISAIYLLLGVLSIYASLIIFFLPLLTIPLVKFHHGIKLKSEYIVVDLITILLMYLLSDSLINIVTYTVMVLFPAYTIIKFNENRFVNYPYIILVIGVIIWGGLLLQEQVMRYEFGISLYNEYMLMIKDVLSQTATTVDDTAYYLLYEIMGSIYEGTLFGSALLISFITVNITQKREGTDTVVNQLLNYRLSKFTMVLLIMTIWIIIMSPSYTVAEVGINLLTMLTIMFYATGMWGIVSLVIKAKLTTMAKIIFVTLLLLILPIISLVPMIYGMIDTIFNVRKAEIVV